MLRHLANTERQGEKTVVSQSFRRQECAIALPADSGFREPIKRSSIRRSRSLGRTHIPLLGQRVAVWAIVRPSVV